MIQSRLLTYGFRLFFGFALFAWFAAFLFALGGNLGTDQGPIDSVLGPLTAGWKGGVGNHLGFTVLLSITVTAGLIAAMLIAFRDADAEAQAQVLDAESVPLTRAPYGVSYAPMAVALLVVAALVALVASSNLIYVVGFGLLAAVFVWTVRTWANRATGDDRTNSELYHQFMEPLRLPVLSAAIILFVALGLSRALLALTHLGAVILFSTVAVLFFVAVALLANAPKVSRNSLTLAVVVGALVVLALAIWGLVAADDDPGDNGGSQAASAVVIESNEVQVS